MSQDGRVLISTHDLARAGALREGFNGAGYATDLVTPDERIGDDDDALLVLTGGAENGGGRLAARARDSLHIPVFAWVDEDDLPPATQRAGYEEVFPASASIDDIVLLGRRVMERKRLRELTGIVGETDAMRQVLERVVQIAPVASTVLITGESGTGKELVARGIHALSPRRHKAFIAVNVAALSETLLESELFGHEKGAFTGAVDSRRGLFELAHGGSIFLDEIGEMPLATQTKLLRVLEQREFLRVGGEVPIKVDVRIVAATNQDLRQLVAIGEFRRDLYFRLNVLSIELPPLRDRRDDIPLLVNRFVREVSDKNGLSFPGISPEAMEILADYSWPGNIRELRNLVESMVVLAPGRVIRPEDIPDDVRGRRGAALLPVPIPRGRSDARGRGEARGSDDEGLGSLRPELEFIFRTLVEMRVDIDELKRDFEAYRRDVSTTDAALLGHTGTAAPYANHPLVRGIEVPAYVPGTEPGPSEVEEPDEPEPESVVVYRPGMTIEEMEREAIAAALDEVDGNRRKAAELLGIGERTLYRKISKYDLDP